VTISLDIFKPDGFNHTRMFLILFCLTLALQTLVNFRKQFRYFKTSPHRIYGKPIRLLGKFQLPALSDFQFILLGFLFSISLLLAAINIFPRFFIFLALLSYFPYFNSIMSLSFIQRKTNLIPIVLFVLLFAPSINGTLDNNTPQFPIILIKIAIAQMYFSAGLQKLRRTGLRWCNGESLQAYLIDHYLWGDTKLALILAKRKNLCMILSMLLLSFELTFWIIIPLPQLTYFYVAAALSFHLGTRLSMRINYLKYLTPVYMIFFTDLAFKLKDKFGI
jgi:hypothetical protein